MTNITAQKEGSPFAHTNRLAHETSTYLLQHAHNPVDWYPWGPEALSRAVKEERPILLSIGYAACHWCHVMEHESFEDEATAKIMNDNFVCIKVDREERTDLDEIYMKAVQAMTGHGGWPMTVFLTPDLKPFFGGTYFPPEDRHGMPSFKRILLSIIEAWKEKRHDIEESATEITEHLQSVDEVISNAKPKIEFKQSEWRDRVVAPAERMLKSFDPQWGGFGNSPKFPHTFSIGLGMRAIAHLEEGQQLSNSLAEMLVTTLDKMAEGGINDQVGGGFARYSVDRRWLVPHFEKMLYDNALLCQTYVDGYFLTGRQYWRRVAETILDFVERELETTSGAFYSSLDADSEGEEGKFYVWTQAEFDQVLGADGGWLSTVYGVTKDGNFEHGNNVLHLTDSPEKLSAEKGLSIEQFWQKVDLLNERLFEQRKSRVRPGRDEKVLTSWNSLMISAFVDGFKASGNERYLETARRAPEFIFKELYRDGRLLRTWGQGKAKLNAYLDDYAYFAQALLDLASVDPDRRWLNEAHRLTTEMLNLFQDDQKSGFFYTSNDHEKLLSRPRSHYDGSIPSGTSVAVMNLLRLGKIFDKRGFLDLAERILKQYLPLFAQMPDQFANMVQAFDLSNSRALEIVLVQSGDARASRDLLLEIHRHYLPNKVVVVKDALAEEKNQQHTPEAALLLDRVAKDGKPTVFICENYACEQPIVDIDELKLRMSKLSTTLDWKAK